MRTFNYLVLLIAIAISICSGYYSVVGLTTIFPGAFQPIAIMGAVLELGKLAAATWLHLHWKLSSTKLFIKAYMLPAIIVLMLITAMGSYGFLARAHIEHTALQADTSLLVKQLDDQVEFQKKTIANTQNTLAQLDTEVSSLVATSSKQGSVVNLKNAQQASRMIDQSTKLRTLQAPQRKQLNDAIEAANQKIAGLTDQKIKLQQQQLKADAEVGPIKYIAQLVYGDNPENNLLERAVRWVILILVVVFDPLAMVLILAAAGALTSSRSSTPEERMIEKLDEFIKSTAKPVEIATPFIVPQVPAEPQIVERIVEKPVEKIVEVENTETIDALREEVANLLVELEDSKKKMKMNP
jgi:hypothetical protein